MENEVKEKAQQLYEAGLARDLYELVEEYLERRDPAALYYWSCISLSEWDETEEESNKRRIELLTESSSGGEPRASYQLACCYMFGDSVEVDQKKAVEFAKLAINAGCEKAKSLLKSGEQSSVPE